jgi:hypothetical protein
MKNNMILELVVSKLMTTKLFEFAFERKKAIDKIESLNDELAYHILKTIIFQNSVSRNSYLEEINAWLAKINKIRLKPDNKKFSVDNYMEFLWERYLETPKEVKIRINELINEYPTEQPINIKNIENIYKFIKKVYLEKICIPIAKDKFISLKIEDFDIN